MTIAMMTPLKWLFVALLTIAVVLVIVYSSSVQNIATRTIAETDVTTHTTNAGSIRTNINQDGSLERPIRYLDKDEIVSNLLAEIMSTQKGLTYDISFDYVFVDNSGKVTTKDNQIRGIQYRVQYLDEAGVVKGTAERHLTLNQLK